MNEKKPVEPEDHHKQLSLCTTRPPYRQGRKLTAVKVYTINDESQHLLVFGVPSLKLLEDLKRTCFKYGMVKSVKTVKKYPDVEEFTEVYHIHYQKLSSARFAKKKLDSKSFYGGVLHVCYAPELESLEETRAKLAQRRKEPADQVPQHWPVECRKWPFLRALEPCVPMGRADALWRLTDLVEKVPVG